MRARIILACEQGGHDGIIAERAGVNRTTVGKWRRRFLERGADGLLDEPRPGAPRQIKDADVERVIARTLETKPKAATHWSTRTMADEMSMSQSAISRIWRAFGLQPHRVTTFKLSKDPLFIEKVRDIVGLYMSPPERAIVLCVDEKSQIQALDRTQPLLPMRSGHVEARTHDYVRHGTTSLFAALDVTTGRVIGECHRRHRALEFRKFLDTIDDSVPDDLDVHVILDNSSTHKTAGHSSMAGEAASLSPALHADQFVVAESRRTLVRCALRQADQTRYAPEHARTRSGDPTFHRSQQRLAEALHLDEDGGRHPREAQELLLKNFRFRTLVHAA